MKREASTGRVGRWEQSYEETEGLVLRVDGPGFEHACAEGSLLSIAQAAGLGSAAPA